MRPTPDPRTKEGLEEMYRALPPTEQHHQAFRLLGSEFVFTRRIRENEIHGVGRNAWAVLVRFGLVVETMFGLTREVLLLYSPYSDLQMRTVQAIPEIRALLPREVTPRLVLIACPDPRAAEKLDDWSTHDLLAIPLPFGRADEETGAGTLLRALEQRLYMRDVYAETAPVYGSGFFGRQIQLQALTDDIAQNRVSGIFGLRKSGKTSLLRQLEEEVIPTQRPRTLFVRTDLEDLPALPSAVIPHVMADLRDDLLAVLRQRKLQTRGLADVDTNDVIAFKRGLQNLLRWLSRNDHGLVIALDEIEYLCPPDKIDLETEETQQIPQFLGALRSLVQENDNFTFVISGLASAVVEAGMLYGRHNPLFSWAKSYYLPPFAPVEAELLLTTLGRRMGVDWDHTSIENVYAESGGHPFLLRDLASAVTRELPLRVGQRHVKRGIVQRALPGWRRATAANVREMLSYIERYYPTEKVLLDLLQEDPASFEAIARDEPQGLHHLLSLGLIRESAENVFELSTLVARQ